MFLSRFASMWTETISHECAPYYSGILFLLASSPKRQYRHGGTNGRHGKSMGRCVNNTQRQSQWVGDARQSCVYKASIETLSCIMRNIQLKLKDSWKSWKGGGGAGGAQGCRAPYYGVQLPVGVDMLHACCREFLILLGFCHGAVLLCCHLLIPLCWRGISKWQHIIKRPRDRIPKRISRGETFHSPTRIGDRFFGVGSWNHKSIRPLSDCEL